MTGPRTVDLIRSVSGVRGIVRSDDPSRINMTEDVARRMGRAYATYILRSEGGRKAGCLVGGRDGRSGGDRLLAAFAEGARASGVQVVELGIVTTPGVAMAVRNLHADGGVVITASHNPAEYNGIKLMTPAGHAPPKSAAETIYAVYDAGDFHDGPVEPPSDPIQFDPHAHHVAAVLKTVDVERIRKRRFKVVLDSINASGIVAGRMLLEKLGCELVHVNAELASTFAHRPEPVQENLEELCRTVALEEADIGFAQDPDADRVAVVDENGRFIGEEYSLVLAAMRVFTTHPGPVAANLSTSRMIDDLAARYGGLTVYRAAVGEANVVETMKAHDCVIGGEGNGGVIDPRVVHVRDSLCGIALVLDLMAAEERTVSQFVADIGSYAMLKTKMTCDLARIRKALTAVKRAFPEARIDETDGVRLEWPADRAWVHVRGSNTEPIMRLFVETPTSAASHTLMDRLRKAVDAA